MIICHLLILNTFRMPLEKLSVKPLPDHNTSLFFSQATNFEGLVSIKLFSRLALFMNVKSLACAFEKKHESSINAKTYFFIMINMMNKDCVG